MKKTVILLMPLLMSLAASAQTTLTLEQSKSVALKNSKILKNSALEIEAAKQLKKSAFTYYFPKINASLFGMYAKDPLLSLNLPQLNLPVYNGNPATLPLASQFAYFPGMDASILKKSAMGVLNVTQPVFAGGKILIGNKLAKLNVDIKEQQQVLTEKELLLKTEQQYWQLISLQEKQKTLETYQVLLEDIRKQVEDAFKSGLVVKNDVLKVQMKQNELLMNKNRLLNGKKLATMQFCHTIGIPFDSTLVLSQTIDQVQEPAQYYVDNRAVLSNRTEYQLLEKSVVAADLQKRMKTAEYLPTVAVGLAGYHFNQLDEKKDSYTNGVAYATVSIPLSDWWGGYHSIKEQKIRKEIAENNVEDNRDLLLLQMEKAWTDVSESRKQIVVLETTELQALENLKISQTGYASGIVTLSDLLESQALVQEVTNNLIEAKIQYQLAITGYLQMSGRK